jgi:hypothetical protein
MVKFPTHVPLTRMVSPVDAASIFAWRLPPESQFTDDGAARLAGARKSAERQVTAIATNRPVRTFERGIIG